MRLRKRQVPEEDAPAIDAAPEIDSAPEIEAAPAHPVLIDRSGPEANRPAVPPWLESLAGWAWRLLVIIVAGGGVLFAMIQLRLVLIPIVAALFLATLLVPPRRWLSARGLPRLAGAITVIVVFFGFLVGLGALLAPGIVAQGEELGGTIGEGVERVEDWLAASFGITGREVEEAIDRAGQEVRQNVPGIATGVLSGAILAAEVVAGLLLTLVVLFFFVKDGDRISTWALEHFPSSGRERVRRAGMRAWSVLGAYVRGQALVGLIDAAVIGVGLALLGIPLVLPLVVLTFIGAFLPLIGAVLAGAVAALVALAAVGVTKALLVVALVVVVQQLEGDLLAPLILGRAVKLHPLAIVLVLTAGAVLGGVVGAVLSVPVAAVAVGATNELRRSGAPATRVEA